MDRHRQHGWVGVDSTEDVRAELRRRTEGRRLRRRRGLKLRTSEVEGCGEDRVWSYVQASRHSDLNRRHLRRPSLNLPLMIFEASCACPFGRL